MVNEEEEYYDDEDYDDEIDYFETEEYYNYFIEALQLQLEKAVEIGLISDSQDYLSLVENDEQVFNFAVLLMSVQAHMYSVMNSKIDEVYDSFNLEVAEDDDLDNFGDILGLERPDGTKASVNLTFTKISEEHTETVINPAGVIVSTENGVQYVTDENLVFPVGVNECNVNALAAEVGAGQLVKANTLVNIESELIDGLECTVTNPNESTGGTSMMEDETYREELQMNYLVHRRGNLNSYYEFFDTYDGLRSYNIYPLWDGAGSLKIVVDAAENVEYHVQNVYEGILGDVCIADENISVVAASKQDITINVIADVETDLLLDVSDTEKNNIKSQIIDMIYVYINGGTALSGDIISGLGIGEDFIPFQLAVFLNSEIEEIQNLSITYPVNPIKVEDDSVINIGKKEDINVILN